jgi:hypothetical protein
MLRAGLLVAWCVFWGMQPMAYAQPEQGETRGALLYATYCDACHTSEIHWREQKLATDLDSLSTQVRRWQGNIGQEWTEADIADVVRHLNAVYYHFPEGKSPAQVPRK